MAENQQNTLNHSAEQHTAASQQGGEANPGTIGRSNVHGFLSLLSTSSAKAPLSTAKPRLRVATGRL